jgi:hypothetical protein
MPTIACPYCNATVPVPEPAPAGTVPCPRCGEAVRVRAAAGSGTTPSPAAGVTARSDLTPPLTSRPSNRAVAQVVVGVMLFLAGITLIYALRTTELRRANDFKGAKEPEPPAEVRPAPPAEWTGLGYLPDDTHAVAGIRLAPAWESEAGRALLAQLGFAPDTSGRGPILGLTPGEVDQLLLRVSLIALPPQITAVIRTRQPLDAGRVRGAIPGARSVEHQGKALIQGKLWPGGLEGVVWQPDGRTLIAAQLPEDFNMVPAVPQPDIHRFTAPLPELLTRRLDPAAQVWLAAFNEPNNAALDFVTGLLPLPPAERDAWSRLAALAVSVRADGPKLVLTVALRGREAASSDALADAVAKSLGAAGVAAERAADGDWRRLTAAADAAALAKWLGSLRGGARKSG